MYHGYNQNDLVHLFSSEAFLEPVQKFFEPGRLKVIDTRCVQPAPARGKQPAEIQRVFFPFKWRPYADSVAATRVAGDYRVSAVRVLCRKMVCECAAHSAAPGLIRKQVRVRRARHALRRKREVQHD